MISDALRELLATLGITVGDERLWLQAFTHLSFAIQEGGGRKQSYKPIEWQGDSIVALAVRSWLDDQYMDTKKIHAMSGFFTSNYFLAKEVGVKYRLDRHARFGTKKRPSRSQLYLVRAQLTESMLGAVRIDQGAEAAVELAVRLLERPMARDAKSGMYDPVTLLRRRSKRRFKIEPEYVDAEYRGRRWKGYAFASTVDCGEGRTSLGFGPRPSLARRDAAMNALAKYFEIQLKDEEGE